MPTTPVFTPYPRSVQVGEFEVAITGGICLAISHSRFSAATRLAQVMRISVFMDIKFGTVDTAFGTAVSELHLPPVENSP